MIEFFRHCPGCGRRFDIRLVEKDELSSYDSEISGPIGMVGGGGVAYVGEGAPMYFDIKEFAYHYKCKHCGHEWTETRLKDEPLQVDMDPIND